jgi:two-component system, response regulator PdtaR
MAYPLSTTHYHHMSKLKILLLEDDPIQATALGTMFTNNGYAVAGIANAGEKALKIFREQQPDLAVLDINVKGSFTGIDIAKIINQERRIPIVFVTAYPEKFDDAKSTFPAAFIGKPYNERDLINAVDLAVNNFFTTNNKEKQAENIENTQSKDPSNILFSQDSLWIKPYIGEPFQKVLVDDIMWIEADNVYIDIHTTLKPTPFKLTLGFSDFIKKAHYSAFVQVHRSYCVNIKYVEKFDSTRLFLKNEVVIPISKTYLQNVLMLLKG